MPFRWSSPIFADIGLRMGELLPLSQTRLRRDTQTGPPRQGELAAFSQDSIENRLSRLANLNKWSFGKADVQA